LTRTQLNGWLAYYRLRPFGSKRDDLRQGVASFWQVSCMVEKPPEDHAPEKYMLKFDDAPPLNEAEVILQRIRERLSG